MQNSVDPETVSNTCHVGVHVGCLFIQIFVDLLAGLICYSSLMDTYVSLGCGSKGTKQTRVQKRLDYKICKPF